MTKANKQCCNCGRCYSKSECRPPGAGFAEAFVTGGGQNGVDDWCCNCMPSQACVSLYSDSDCCNSLIWSSGTQLVDALKTEWCNDYGGEFECDNGKIDFAFDMIKDPADTGNCFLCLSSVILGYLESGGQDTRVCLPMGGTGHSNDVKISTCTSLGLEFDISFAALSGHPDFVAPYCDSGSIIINPADNIAASGKPGLLANPSVSDCLYTRACILYNSGDFQDSAKACYDAESSGWAFTFDSDLVPPSISVSLNGDSDPPYLSMTSDYFSGSAVDATCPQMEARWDNSDTEWIRIRGDLGGYCTDCECNCRCLCVNYIGSDKTQDSLTFCFDQTGVNTMAGIDFSWDLKCGCENNNFTTTLGMSVSSGTIVGDIYKSIICPDQLDATWSIEFSETESASVRAKCAECSDDCPPELGVTACFDNVAYRVRPIPLFLFATIESIDGCDNLDGEVIDLEIENIDAATPCWQGSGTTDDCTTYISITCATDDNGSGIFKLYPSLCSIQTGAGNIGNTLSTDPLEVEFDNLSGIFGCCEPYANLAEVKVTVTE